MRYQLISVRSLAILTLSIFLFAPPSVTVADEAAKKADAADRDTADEKESDGKAEASEAKKEEKKTPKKPKLPAYEFDDDASIDELAEFIEKLKSHRPKDRKSASTHFRKARPAVEKANARMLELMEEVGETDSDRYFDAKRSVLARSVSKLRSRSAEEAMTEILDFFDAVGDRLNERDGQTAVMAGYYLSSNSSIDPDEKSTFLTKVTSLLRDASQENSAEMLEGIVRRGDLIGKELKLSGSRMNGDKFDIKELRGKVVLVDFWATWCGPCIAEHPNIKRNYDKFNDMGFEVVGLSLDRDRDRLEKFLEEHETDWIVLHDEGGKNDATTYYGVIGIPSMFLLDQDGKVVSTTARGSSLGKELVKLLGEPIEKKGEPKDEGKDAEDSKEADKEA